MFSNQREALLSMPYSSVGWARKNRIYSSFSSCFCFRNFVEHMGKRGVVDREASFVYEANEGKFMYGRSMKYSLPLSTLAARNGASRSQQVSAPPLARTHHAGIPRHFELTSLRLPLQLAFISRETRFPWQRGLIDSLFTCML